MEALRGADIRWVEADGKGRAETGGVDPRMLGPPEVLISFPAGSTRSRPLAADPPSFHRFAATALSVCRRTPDLLRSGDGGRGEMGRTGKRSSPAEEPSCSGRSEAGSEEK